jgi:hypothetical protein
MMDNYSTINLLQSVDFESIIETRGSPHRFERTTGTSGICIVCRESVNFFSAYLCTGT